MEQGKSSSYPIDCATVCEIHKSGTGDSAQPKLLSGMANAQIRYCGAPDSGMTSAQAWNELIPGRYWGQLKWSRGLCRYFAHMFAAN